MSVWSIVSSLDTSFASLRSLSPIPGRRGISRVREHRSCVYELRHAGEGPRSSLQLFIAYSFRSWFEARHLANNLLVREDHGSHHGCQWSRPKDSASIRRVNSLVWVSQWMRPPILLQYSRIAKANLGLIGIRSCSDGASSSLISRAVAPGVASVTTGVLRSGAPTYRWCCGLG